MAGRSVLLFSSGVLLVAATVSAAPHTMRASAASSVPVFAHPVTANAEVFAGEPDDTIGADGRTYISAPWGVQTNTSFIWRSEDGGESFRQIQAAPGVQNPYAFRAGGDTEVQAFPPAGPSFPGESSATPTRVYFANQDNLDTITCGYTDDAGRSFTFLNGTSQGGVCPANLGADRQWLAETRVDPGVPSGNSTLLNHDVSYLWYDNTGLNGDSLFRSDDGINYGTAGVVATAAGGDGLGNPGNVVADRATGVVYMSAPSSGTSNNGVQVFYSADGGKTLHAVQAVADQYAGSTGTDFSVLAIDDKGNLYLAYTPQNGTSAWQTYVTHTTGFTTVNNGIRNVAVAGATAAGWTAPVPVTGPGSANPGIHYSVFPWIDAGDSGRVNVAFYGTTHPVGYDPNTQNAAWRTYVTQSLNATPSNSSATFGPAVSVAEGATHLASICFNGVGCTGMGNRNLLDFFEVRHDANGAAVVAYNDDANSLVAAFPGGPFVMEGRQVGGPTLFASANGGTGRLNGAPTPDTAFQTDRSGDGFTPTNDTNVASLDLLGTGAVLKDPSTLEVTIKVSNLANAVAQITNNQPGEGATGISYELTWKHANDLWFVGANVDSSGTFTYNAGRPQSVPFTVSGGPKFAVYATSQNASPVTTGSANTTTGVITIDVPTSMLGNLQGGDRLLQATGFTLVQRGAAGAAPLADQADATPSFDDSLGGPGPRIPEVPFPVVLVILGGVIWLAVLLRRRARAR